jgi:hypothetical protein
MNNIFYRVNGFHFNKITYLNFARSGTWKTRCWRSGQGRPANWATLCNKKVRIHFSNKKVLIHFSNKKVRILFSNKKVWIHFSNKKVRIPFSNKKVLIHFSNKKVRAGRSSRKPPSQRWCLKYPSYLKTTPIRHLLPGAVSTAPSATTGAYDEFLNLVLLPERPISISQVISYLGYRIFIRKESRNEGLRDRVM